MDKKVIRWASEEAIAISKVWSDYCLLEKKNPKKAFEKMEEHWWEDMLKSCELEDGTYSPVAKYYATIKSFLRYRY